MFDDKLIMATLSKEDDDFLRKLAKELSTDDIKISPSELIRAAIISMLSDLRYVSFEEWKELAELGNLRTYLDIMK